MKILVFESTRAVIKAEKLIRAAEIECRIIPVPRTVSPLCGMAVELDEGSLQKAAVLLEEKNIKTDVFDRGEVSL
ncbi:MAG: DUF3343 domain-containing protein [Spirochaetales bacterium]|uniref:DUF3343 domain-containing protein n=1 Tax=Candidatus Thalassospirochaeta sargassi TaxID=3119039 RepID=A0AAJ1ID98_9SPIO|nr:DUF3343 domain-containing protein [Spirochaetales bacterium]